jgi:hypothetical protein
MKVVDVERIVCEVPFTERQARITEREVYTWNVIELCKVTLDSGLIGCESFQLVIRSLSRRLAALLQRC